LKLISFKRFMMSEALVGSSGRRMALICTIRMSGAPPSW
jgi:hypothetical protein